MPTFLLITDIDKNASSWYKWRPYDSDKIYETDFVDQLKKIGKVYIPQPNFVNFRKYAKYDKNIGYNNDIIFSIKDLEYENHAKWLYNQIDENDRHNIIVIGLEQGCHHAKFFANTYHNQCIGLFILGDRILTKENYKKILTQNETYINSLKEYFGDKYNDYTIENITDEKLTNIINKVKHDDNMVMFLNGFVKLKTRSQFDKIKKTLVPTYIYTYKETQTDISAKLHKQFIKDSKPIHVEYNYLHQDAPYFIFSKYKDEILDNIRSIIKPVMSRDKNDIIKKTKIDPKYKYVEYITYKKIFNVANNIDDDNLNENSEFMIGSITKVFTLFTLLILHQNNLLNINDTVDKYIKSNPNNDFSTVTLINLMNHKSGMKRMPTKEKHIKFKSATEFLNTFINEACFTEKKGDFFYSNIGIILLGAIIEKVCNMTYLEAYFKYIFKPLNITNTNVGKTNITHYTYYRNKLTKKQFNERYWASSAGSLYSTINDLLIFSRHLPELLNDSTKKILSTLYIYSVNNNKLRIDHGGDIHGGKAMLSIEYNKKWKMEHVYIKLETIK